MITIPQLTARLSTLDQTNSAAIDDGGSMLVEIDPNGRATTAYLEVGGYDEQMPTDRNGATAATSAARQQSAPESR